MPELIITVNKKGETTVSVNGVSGASCKDLSASIEKAIGQSVKTELTADYYQEIQSNELQAGQL